MNPKEKKGLEKIVISFLVLFLVLSLSLHNHAFYFGASSEKISQLELVYPNHSKEFCSSCRLNGNIKPHEVTNIFNPNFLGILIAFLDLDVIIPSLSLTSKKSPRSPPTI
jgi:hypothetical protein